MSDLTIYGSKNPTIQLTGFLSNAALRGIPVELRTSGTYLQWKYQDEDTWKNLINLNDIDYEALQNIPSVNNVALTGNKYSHDLGLSAIGEGVTTITRNGTTFTVTRPNGTTFTFDQEANVIESISVNGDAQTISNKNVDITVPTAVSELTNDSNFASVEYVDTEVGKKVKDVQVNGTSVVNNGVANIPIASAYNLGAVKVSGSYGIMMSNGEIVINRANSANIKEGSDQAKPIVPRYQYVSAFYGLAKAAGDSTQSASSNPVGTYTDNAKAAIRTMLGTPSTDDIPEVPVQDVQVNGSSILDASGVAEIPIADSNALGIVKVNDVFGIGVNNGMLMIASASSDNIKGGANGNKPITAIRQHESAFYGLAKAAGADMASSSNAVGTYTEAAKTAIQSMLGVDTAIADAIGQITGFDFEVVQELPATGEKGIIYLVAHSHDTDDGYDEYIWIETGFEKLGHTDLEVPVQDVQVNGTSVLNNGVANVPVASRNNFGVVKLAQYKGVNINANGELETQVATDAYIKGGTTGYAIIDPLHQHKSTFYGLAKAAGDSTQSASSNAVGTYTDEAKAAIQTMLGVPSVDDIPDVPVTDVTVNGTSVVTNGVAEIPLVSHEKYGLVKYGAGLMLDGSYLVPMKASGNQIKAGTTQYSPIVPFNQHNSVFYGLAKAAGDTTQAQSTNAVGTYTDNAKASIKAMLGIGGETRTVIVSGTAPVITAVANARYVCGEVTSIDITPPGAGICEIVFTSGSTVAVLTATGVTWPEWFDPTALEADTTYEISISDGRGAVGIWPA